MSKNIEELTAQNNALKCQVNELSACLSMVFNGGWDKEHSRNISDHTRTVLNHTAVQCLNQIKADAVTAFANRYCGDCTTEYQARLNADANEWVYSVTTSGEE